jgi:hypothetical protein
MGDAGMGEMGDAGMGEMEGGDLEFDGGDEENKEEGAAAGGDGAEEAKGMEASVTDPRTKTTDEVTFSSFADAPACYLRNAVKNPFFGDLIKSHVINWEFFRSKASQNTWGGVAGLLTSGIVTGTRAEAETWFSGFVGELDHASLSAMDKSDILFPGWIEGWTSEQDAADYLKSLDANKNSKENVQKVILKVTGAHVLSYGGNRAIAHRLAATINKVEAKDGVLMMEAAGKAPDNRTIAEVAAELLKAKEAPPVTDDANKEAGAGDMGMGEAGGDMAGGDMAGGDM